MVAYLVCALGLVVAYVAVATMLWATRDFADDGPLGLHAPAATAPLDLNGSLDAVRQQCLATGGFFAGHGDTVKIVATRHRDRTYYACYEISDGEVVTAAAIDANGLRAPDSVIKRLGAWPSVGLVTSVTDLTMGGVTLTVLLALYLFYYRRARPGPPAPARWWQTPTANALLGTTGLLPFTLPFRGNETRARRIRLLYRFGFGWAAAITCSLLLDTLNDRTGETMLGLIGTGQLLGWFGGQALLRPAGFGSPDQPGSTGAPR